MHQTHSSVIVIKDWRIRKDGQMQAIQYNKRESTESHSLHLHVFGNAVRIEN